jgi:hypothetical protein
MSIRKIRMLDGLVSTHWIFKPNIILFNQDLVPLCTIPSHLIVIIQQSRPCLMQATHRHLKNIDCLTVCTTCLVCFNSIVNGRGNKKRKEKKKLTLGRPALVAGTLQNLSNLFWRLLISMRPL